MKMLLELCLLSTIILLTNAHTSGSTCVPIPELSSRPSWISWCQTNCQTAAGTHPACDGDGVHVKCKCGEDSSHPIAKEPNSCTPIPELWNEQKWVTWCKTNCGNPAGSHPACNGTGAHVKCNCGYSASPCDTQLSRHALRCGPKWGGRCNKNKVHYALYCKVSSGWCSRKPKSNSPTRDDSYDWEPASCKDDVVVFPTTESPTNVPRGGRGLLIEVNITSSHSSITVYKDEPYELVCNAPNVEIKGCLFTDPSGKSFILWSGASYEGGRVKQKGYGTSTCAVAINKAEDSDNGKWQCQISYYDANNNPVSSTANVDVTVAGLDSSESPFEQVTTEASTLPNLSGYTLKAKSYCEQKHSKKTQTLSEAQERCSADSTCAMFYSDYSNNYDQYFLCSHGAKIKESWRHHSTLYVKDSYSPYACKPGYCTPPYGNSINGTLHEVGIACISDYPKCKAYQYSASRGYGHLCATTKSSKSDDMEDYKSCVPPFVTSIDTIVGVWETITPAFMTTDFVNCTKVSNKEVECRYSSFVFNEVQMFQYDDENNLFRWIGGENNVLYTGGGVWSLDEQDYDYGNLGLKWTHNQYWKILGFKAMHKLKGRWRLSPGQDPIDYQLHCYEFESQFPKSEYRCELFGSSEPKDYRKDTGRYRIQDTGRFSLIHYDESTDSYIVNGENAGKPNVILDTESGNEILEWDPMGMGFSKWTKSGFTLETLIGSWDIYKNHHEPINTTLDCTKVSAVKVACNFTDVTGQSIITPFDYDPATSSLSYGELSFRPAIFTVNGSKIALSWVNGVILVNPQEKDECYFSYGFGSRMVPCCLNLITRQEHDRLVEFDKTNRLIGGAVGKHHFCPKDAPEAHQALTGLYKNMTYDEEFNAFEECCNNNWHRKCATIRIDCGTTVKPGKNSNCLPNECWCVSAGGNTCGYSTNETCDPDECSDRDECPGYGYWCKDAAVEKCYCEFKNADASNNGIMCNTTDGSAYLFGSCDKSQLCTGNETEDYLNRKLELCEKNEGTKLEGETCGSCFSSSTNFTCGTCIEGLECMPDENAAMLPDLPSRCRTPQKCKNVNISDPSFDPNQCGEECGGNPFSDVTSFCRKGEKCCPFGPQGSKCATTCGPYDKTEIFGSCEDGCCIYQDAPCNMECKENGTVCKYADWVFEQYEPQATCALPKQEGDCWLTGRNVTYLDEDSGFCRVHKFSGCDISGHISISSDSIECGNLRMIDNSGDSFCLPCQVHRDSENARLAESPFPVLGYFVPECEEDGNFKSKQSSGSSGYSFCLDIDGNKVHGSDTPPGQDLDCSQYQLNRRPSVGVEQYLGHWKQQVTHDQEAYDVMCTEVHKLQTPTRVDVSISCEVQGLLSNPFTNTFSLKDDAIINNDVSGIKGKLNSDGSITWLKNGIVYTSWERPIGFKRKCNFGRNQLKYASPEDSQLAEDFGISKCTSEIPGECCREDEMCKCEGEVLEIFPPQCSVEPTYCEPKDDEFLFSTTELPSPTNAPRDGRELNLFSKINGKFCGRGTQCNQNEKPRYGNFSTFEAATMACSNDPLCEMVMDRECDGQGYELCSSTPLCRSAEGTCSFQRLSGEFETDIEPNIPIRNQGEVCGQCNNPNDSFFCGDCSQGLECIAMQQEGIDDGMLEKRCHKKEDACMGHLCKNGGTCDIQNENVTCVCTPFYGGARCEKQVLERRSVTLTKDINGGVSYHLKQGVVFSIDSDSSTINTKVVKKIEIGDQIWESHGKKFDEKELVNIEDVEDLSEITSKIHSSNDDATLTLHLPTVLFDEYYGEACRDGYTASFDSWEDCRDGLIATDNNVSSVYLVTGEPMEQIGCFKPESFSQFYFNPINPQKNDGNRVKYSMICKSVLGDDIDIMKYDQEGSGEETTEESSGREDSSYELDSTSTPIELSSTDSSSESSSTPLITTLDYIDNWVIGSNVEILSPGDGHWGTWTEWKNCPRGSYATAFRLRFEPSQGKSGDDSGLNAVHLRCNSLNGSETSILSPHDGHAGDWTSFSSNDCFSYMDGLITGASIEIYPKRSVFSMADNRGATNLKMFCNNNEILSATNNDKRGEWGEEKWCSENMAICGLQVRMASATTAMNGAKFKCCELPEVSTTITQPATESTESLVEMSTPTTNEGLSETSGLTTIVGPTDVSSMDKSSSDIKAWYNSSDGMIHHQFTLNGCCVAKGSFHRNCICPSEARWDNDTLTFFAEGTECEHRCITDKGCKGYALQNTEFPDRKRFRYCFIATTSNCPSDCKGPFSKGNTQDLDADATSGRCFVKQSGIASLQDLNDIISGRVLMIDVRNSTEFAMERLENSVNVPYSDVLNGAFLLNDTEFLTKYGIYKPSVNQSFIVSGFENDISRQAAKYLRIMLGYSGIKIYYGYIEDWQSTGGTVLTRDGRWVKHIFITHAGTIDFVQLRTSIEYDTFTIIDVRDREDVYSKGMIPKSYNVPENEIVGQIKAFELSNPEFKQKYGHDKPRIDEYFVIICTRGVRAESVVQYLKSLGYSNAIIYPGSFDDWAANGGDIIKRNRTQGNIIRYDKHSGKFCGKGNKCNTEEEPRYGNYSSLEEAAAACDLDDNCEMVMDHYCDNSGPFELCSSSSLCRSGQGTCSYQKPAAQIIDQCCFQYGIESRFGSKTPCCLNMISCEEHDRLVEENARNPMLGGAIGKHHYCPENAEEAHQILSATEPIIEVTEQPMNISEAKCGLKIYDRYQGSFNDPNFSPDDCGQTCGGSYEGTTMFYCEKGEVCCPSGPSDQSCSKTCGQFDPRESFGECESTGSCSHLCLADAPCHIECKRDQHCRYVNSVFSRTTFSLDTLVGKWRFGGWDGQMACVKQSNFRSSCKVMNGNSTPTNHMFDYDQSIGKYKLDAVSINTPSIVYNGLYQLMIEPSYDSISLGAVLGMNFANLIHVNDTKTLILIEEDYEYTLQEDTWCQPYKYEYSTFLQAKKNCDVDPDCKMFYELVGDNEGFVLCGEDAQIKPSSYNSRLYVRNASEIGYETSTATQSVAKDLDLCPDTCKCNSLPRNVPGRRNIQQNGYCYHFCGYENPSDFDARANNETKLYCGASNKIKSNGKDCRPCRNAENRVESKISEEESDEDSSEESQEDSSEESKEESEEKVSGCFNEKTTAISNHASGEHNFRDIHTPEECQVKCQESLDCQYFVLYLKGRWKGCLLKTSGAKQTVKPHKHAIFGPKYCTNL